MKHKREVCTDSGERSIQVLTFTGSLVSAGVSRLVLLLALSLLCASASYAQDLKCTGVSQSDVDVVFHQALSTVSTLCNAAVRAYQRNTWRPDGGFKAPFFAQASRSLRSIRNLLQKSSQTSSANSAQCITAATTGCTMNAVPKGEVLRQFDLIFKVSFPPGLQGLRTLKGRERIKFIKTLQSLPESYAVCG
jgi:hypothetical protein